MSPWTFAMVFITPLSYVMGWALGGAWTFLTPAAVFVLLPIADGIAGADGTQPTGQERPWAFDALLWLWAPVQLALLAGTAWWVGAGQATPLETLGLVASAATLSGGGGITVAHELMHRRSRVARALAELLMTSVLYTWFCVEHVLGHHRTVATPEDPATAPLGLSLYRYLPRTLLGAPVSAWRLETARVRRRGLVGLADRRIRYPLDLLGALGIAFALGGVGGVAFLVAQAIGAVLLLEVVNYVEHYGLTRERQGDGRYERVGPQHSWNSAAMLTNAYLFNLARHADHHANASRPYYALRTLDGAPTLPAGYAAMVLIALVPPLWFRIMDPLAAQRRLDGARSGP